LPVALRSPSSSAKGVSRPRQACRCPRGICRLVACHGHKPGFRVCRAPAPGPEFKRAHHRDRQRVCRIGHIARAGGQNGDEPAPGQARHLFDLVRRAHTAPRITTGQTSTAPVAAAGLSAARCNAVSGSGPSMMH
jgi:hypothetical protein